MTSDWFAAMVADIADTFYVSPAEVLARGRIGTNATDARHCLAWACRREGLSYPRIGQRIGRDHTTVIASVRRVDGDPCLLGIAQGLRARHPRSRAA